MKDYKFDYDYLVVGAGLFGATCAERLNAAGKSVFVIDKRSTLGGNCYSEERAGIMVYKYGPHIFHTSNERVWEYVNRFAEFNTFINSPLANYKGKLFHLPFNMNTFYELYGCETPAAAALQLDKKTKPYKTKVPKNLEEQALSLVGPDIYKKLIKGYTEKQWGKSCKELPPDIIKRLPLRFTFDNNYFNDKYQGIPSIGYTEMIKNMLEGIEVSLDTSYEDMWILYPRHTFKHIIYTGAIDEYFNYSLGILDYRSLIFHEEELDMSNYQGNAVINFTDKKTPFTRIVEHKHFDKNNKSDKTVITFEIPMPWAMKNERYYPINNEKNNLLYQRYLELAETQPNVSFGGRLGLYKYLDMDDTIEEAFKLVEKLI